MVASVSLFNKQDCETNNTEETVYQGLWLLIYD